MTDPDEPLEDELLVDDGEEEVDTTFYVYGVEGEPFFQNGCWELPVLSFGGDNDYPVYGATLSCLDYAGVKAIRTYFRSNIEPLGPEEVKELFSKARVAALRGVLH